MKKVIIQDLNDHEAFNVGQVMEIRSVNRKTGLLEVEMEDPWVYQRMGEQQVLIEKLQKQTFWSLLKRCLKFTHKPVYTIYDLDTFKWLIRGSDKSSILGLLASKYSRHCVAIEDGILIGANLEANTNTDTKQPICSCKGTNT